MKHRFQLFILIFLSFAVSPLTSYAAEEPPAIAKLLDMVARQNAAAGGNRPVYEKLEADGFGGATLTNLQWSIKKRDMDGQFTVEKVVISGVSKRPSGAYSIESIKSQNALIVFNMPEAGPIRIAIPTASSTNTHLLPYPSPDGIDYTAILGTAVYESSSVPLITISVAGQTFDAKGFSSKWSGDPETGFGKWDVSMQSVVIPVKAFPNPEFQRDMKEEFGFEQFNLAFDGSVAVTGKDKNLNIAYGLRLRGKNIGDIEFAFAGQEIPAQLAAILKQAQTGKKPNMGQLMPLIVGIKFSKLKLRFVDDNFTAKMLAFAAKKQNTTVEQLTANGAALVQIGLMQLNMPEFSQSVVAAYNAFVKDPQNISVEASPEKPVAVSTLMGLMAAPAVAIKTLGVKVEANK